MEPARGSPFRFSVTKRLRTQRARDLVGPSREVHDRHPVAQLQVTILIVRQAFTARRSCREYLPHRSLLRAFAPCGSALILQR